MALLLKMLEEGKVSAAAHCNFHLRGAESDSDEHFVQQLCAKHGVRLHVRHFDTTAEAARTGESIEMAARRLRYEWFAQLCKEHGYTAVAVAHHRDDNAETVLLNLIRGTGLRGLSGMKAERNGVVRPLLKCSRHDILNYLKQKGQPFVTDSTNADTHYRRNRIRHDVLPLLQSINPQVVTAINDMAHHLQGVEKIYDYALSKLRHEVVSEHADGFSIDLEKLKRTPSPATLLHEWLSACAFTTAQVSAAPTMHTGALIDNGQWLLTRTAHSIEVRRHPHRIDGIAVPQSGDTNMPLGDQEISVRHLLRSEMESIPHDRATCVLDADKLCGQLTVRSVAEGDSFNPFGMKGNQLVSDYLTNRHYSRIDKMAALVVCDECGIVWLVGERPSQRTAVSESTRHLIILHTRKL